MPNTPVQRSYPQTLGDLIDSFLSEYGLDSLKVGGPVLSLFEAVAQSQFRNSGDIFTLLAAAALDYATGQALDNIGRAEGVPRQTESPSTGPITIGDSSIAKIATTVYQGRPAPIVGSVNINVTNGASFPATGSVYIGRGTTNYEGPIPYTAVVNNGTYFTLQLATGTQRFHNVNETVILAQGGNRTISAGSLVQTLPTNVLAAVQFKLLYGATVPDGETSVDGVTVVATKPGTVGNVSAKAIKSFVSPPFAGATVINTRPFNNGLSTESDDTYRERIRAARQSRSLGTSLAIRTNAVGTVSPDDNKRVQSASLVTGQNKPTTLYIDDGTGYEEIAEGVAIESLLDFALGGEQDFRLSSQPPVTKAQLVSTLSAPFALSDGARLNFAVGGVTSEHTFNSTEFRSIDNATAYEVVASINANAPLLWSAHTLDAGTRVVVFAKADTNESIQNIAADGIDANPFMGFPSTRVDTLRLYRNDRLLSKDGSVASVSSQAPSLWGSISGPKSLVVAIDGITLKFDGSMFPAFTDADFVSANTGYTTVGNNSPSAWAAVFNYRIPGIKATVDNGLVTLTSNRGMSLGASVEILSGDLVDSAHMFLATKAIGTNSDYSLNRNTGELQLTTPLSAGDTLSAGSIATRAFLQSKSIAPTSITSNGNLWFSIDGDAQVVPSGMTPGVLINITVATPAWGYRVRLTSNAGAALFTKVLPGDWAVCWDPALVSRGVDGAYRIAAIDTTGFTWVEIERSATVTTGTAVSLTQGGISFVRTGKSLQRVTVPSSVNLQTASSFVDTLNGSLAGVTASVYKTNALRLATNTFDLTSGDIALVAADVTGTLLPLATSSAVPNLTGHMASVESGGSELGTPTFHMGRVNALTDSSHMSIVFSSGRETLPSSAHGVVGLRAVDDGVTSTTTRFGSNKGFHSPVSVGTSTSSVTIGGVTENIVPLTMKKAVETSWLLQDRVYFAHPFELAASDTVTVLVDGDASSKRFTVPMARTLKPVGLSYASQNTYIDVDNSNQSLAIGFGLNYDFNDCAVLMAARGRTHTIGTFSGQNGGSLTNLDRTVLWRYNRLGADGNQARVKYTIPSVANSPVAVSVDNSKTQYTDVSIVLASGAQRTSLPLTSANTIGWASTAPIFGMSWVFYILQYPVALAVRSSNVVTLTLSLPPGVSHNYVAGNSLYLTSSSATFPSGIKVLTSTTSTTIVYAETGSDASIPNIGQLALDSNPNNPSFAGSGVVTGDFVHIASTVQVSTSWKNQTFRIANNVSANPYWLQGMIDNFGSTNATVTRQVLGDASGITIYANPAQTITTIAAAVNALAAADPRVPVKAKVIGTGVATNDRSSAEDLNNANAWVQLTDGVNYVQTTTAPGTTAGNYQLTFKEPITADLASDADWQNEVVKIVPRTTKNLVDWMSAPTISGLFTAAEIAASSSATKLQLASLTPGSAGTVQVQGGTGNNLTAPLLGSGTTGSSDSTYMTIQVATANATGLKAGSFVRIDNALPVIKTCINAGTDLASFVISGNTATVTLNAGAIYTNTAAGGSSVALLVEKQGNFVALSDTGLATALVLSGAVEGDFIRIKTPASATLDSTRQVAPANTGIFRIVRVVTPGLDSEGGTVFIENGAAIEQGVAEADVSFLTADSLVAGDIVSISAPLWGTSNAGQWTVTSVGDAGSGEYANALTFKLDATNKTGQTIGAVGPLGASAPLVQVVGGAGRWFKRIHSIAPNQQNASLVDLKFSTSAAAGRINAASGSTLTALDKLGFPLTIAAGIDGYQHSIGLIGEVNRVIYGDPSDPATYPGVVAAAANVNISGALVKRIQVSILLRVRSGAPTKDIADQVRSAVAAVINKKGNGDSIALNSLTDAAGSVPGVVSATMLKPVAMTGSDIIAVQPYEKPLVLSPDLDILVSFVGN